MKSLNLFSTWAEIDLDALAFNFNQVRNYAGKDKKILAVVKANAYGHGLEMISRELESLGVDFLGVALVKEGIQLRKAGIKKPILVLGGVLPFQIEEVVNFKLTPVVIDLQSANLLEAEGKKQKQSIPVHIKIDTGMNRLGIPWQKAKEFFTYFKSLKHLELEGVLSHFSSAHLSDRASQKFSTEQMKRFREVLSILRKLNFNPPLVHMANSAAVIEGLGTEEFNMVRAGIMLYGSYPSEELKSRIELKPVMSVKSQIIQIKDLPYHSPISYGRTFYTKKKSRIAVIGIGYGDGYPFRISNRGKVLIKGEKVPLVGSICMDLMMADVTQLAEVKSGEEVVIFGEQGKVSITVEEMANWAETIPYEILCGISSRVSRVYKKGGEYLNYPAK